VEPGISTPGGLPNAYANIILANERGAQHRPRLYAVYNLNLHNITMKGRGDELGFFYMRFSDDDGRSWSPDRYLVPYPNTWVDNQNDFHGKTHIMWTVDQIKRMPGGAVAFAFTKIGHYVQNPPEEIFFMHSPNLLQATNASDVKWELFPSASDHGLKAPAMYNPNSTVMEEGHLLPLARGGCYAMARTDKGFLAAAWTADSTAAKGWAPTGLARYWNPRTQLGSTMEALEDIPLTSPAPLVPTQVPPLVPPLTHYATALKNSRGPFTPKRQPNGQYLLIWYNNNYMRDPYFLSAGREAADGQILWSQPEVGLYDHVHLGTSAGGYPDFVNGGGADAAWAGKGVGSTASASSTGSTGAGGGTGGGTFITVSQKQVPGVNSTAYIHRVDDDLLSHLFGQFEASGPPSEERLVATVTAADAGHVVPLQLLPGQSWPAIDKLKEARQGFSMVLWLRPPRNSSSSSSSSSSSDSESYQTLLRSGGVRFGISTEAGGGLVLDMHANRSKSEAAADGIPGRSRRSNPMYKLVRAGYGPKKDDGLPIPCQNHVLSGDSAELGCAKVCATTAGCAAFWTYTLATSPSFGRCCFKGAHWVNGTFPADWRAIPGGGFYAMDAPPAPPTPAPPVVSSRTLTDPSCAALLQQPTADDDSGTITDAITHMVAVVVDAGPGLVTFFVDGLVCDGGGAASAGWFWTEAEMGQLLGKAELEVAPDFGGELISGALYFRALYASELVGYYRSMLRWRAAV
jgi:hypothetical protein